MPIDCHHPPYDFDEPPAIYESYKEVASTHRQERIDQRMIDEWIASVEARWFKSDSVQEPTIEERFTQLAAQWKRETAQVSSVQDIISHPNYQRMIDLGWEALPFMLSDLQRSHRFWFPALYEITKVRPYDARDAGNVRRMTKAWVVWGQRKGII